MHSFYSWGSWGKIKRGFGFAVSEKGHLTLPNQETLPTWNEPGPVGILFVKQYLFISVPDAPFPVSTKKHRCKGVFRVLVSHLTFSLKDRWHPRKLFQSEVGFLLQNIKPKFIFLKCWSFFFFFGCAGPLLPQAFSSCSEWGPLFVLVLRLLTAVTFLIAEHGLLCSGFSSCGKWA